MLKGVDSKARHTAALVENIGELLKSLKQDIKANHEFYSDELLNNLSPPYTKVTFIERGLNVSRATATRYLEASSTSDIVSKYKLGKENYYVNDKLVGLLFNLERLE